MPPFARDNGLAPDVWQAIVLTNDAISLTEPLRAKYQWSFNLKTKTQNAISHKKMYAKMLFGTGLNTLNVLVQSRRYIHCVFS